ncbi:MAG: hypothetical protein R2800_13515 [Flavipsychrobacter sp.]
MRHYLLLALAFIAFSACNNEVATTQDLPIRTPTVADQLIAADSIPISLIKDNKAQYSIEILTTTKTDSGEYKLITKYGHITDSMTTRLPYLEQELKVALRRDEDQPFNYIIGFYMEEDSFKIFHDYISVSASQADISDLATQTELKFKYLKAYYLK